VLVRHRHVGRGGAVGENGTPLARHVRASVAAREAMAAGGSRNSPQASASAPTIASGSTRSAR
jgi:hypothetical protein